MPELWWQVHRCFPLEQTDCLSAQLGSLAGDLFFAWSQENARLGRQGLLQTKEGHKSDLIFFH
jgi:hypothetical protein